MDLILIIKLKINRLTVNISNIYEKIMKLWITTDRKNLTKN